MIVPTAVPVKFTVGTGITSSAPELVAGQFLYDTAAQALYLDVWEYDEENNNSLIVRTQIKDPLKLSLTGGALTGDLQIVDNLGHARVTLWRNGDVDVDGYYRCSALLETSEIPDSVAVWVDGTLRAKSLRDIFNDMEIQLSGELDNEMLILSIESGLPEQEEIGNG